MRFRGVYSVRKHVRYVVRMCPIQEFPKAIVPPTTSTQVSNLQGLTESISSLKIHLRSDTRRLHKQRAVPYGTALVFLGPPKSQTGHDEGVDDWYIVRAVIPSFQLL